MKWGQQFLYYTGWWLMSLLNFDIVLMLIFSSMQKCCCFTFNTFFVLLFFFIFISIKIEILGLGTSNSFYKRTTDRIDVAYGHFVGFQLVCRYLNQWEHRFISIINLIIITKTTDGENALFPFIFLATVAFSPFVLSLSLSFPLIYYFLY